MNQHALIIGVESYRDPQISPVPFARSEAQDWEQLLKEICRFQTVKVLAGKEGAPDEPTQTHVFDALHEIAGSVREGDHFVLVFGGHGIEVGGSGSLMLSDCRSYSRTLGMLPWHALRDEFLSRMAARWCTVILDSCRNDPDAGRGDGGGELGSDFFRDFSGLGERRRRDGRMTTLMSACKPGQRAYASSRFKKGVWSHFLHEGIRGAAWQDGVLRLGELARYAHAQVCEWSDKERDGRSPQEPWIEALGTGEEVELARDPGVVRAGEPGEALPDPLPEGGFSWYHGSPLYLSRMASRCARGVWVGGRRVESAQTEWLIRQGVAEIDVRQGELVAVSCPEALLAGGQLPLLRDWLSGFAQGDGLTAVLDEFLAGQPVGLESVCARIHDREQASRVGALIERWQAPDRSDTRRMPEPIRALGKARLMRWGLGRILARAWDREYTVQEWFEAWLRRVPESPSLARLWTQTALEAGQCLGSHDLIGRFADRMSSFCRDSASLVGIAEVLGRHLGEISRAREAMQRAEQVAKSADDFLQCALAWQRLLGESGAAVRCAEEAAREASDLPDWLAVAKARWAARTEMGRVLEALAKAEGSVGCVMDSTDLAGAWLLLADDRAKAEAVLQKAESEVMEACDWFLIARAWGLVLQEPAEASRCLKFGWERCQSAYDWRTCAVAAGELGVDAKSIEECVGSAAAVAATASDWCWVADAAGTALDSRKLAEDHLAKARLHAKDIGDWLCCARMATEPESVLEPLESAERLASDSKDWRRCAEAWVRYGWDSSRGRRCLKQAEQVSRTQADWNECAKFWHDLFLDSASQRNCQQAANGLNGHPSLNQTTISTRTQIPAATNTP